MGPNDIAEDEHLDMGEHIHCKTYTMDQIKNNSTHFSFFHINIRSLNKHHNELEALLSTSNPFDIVGCSETWLHENSHLGCLNIGDYNLMVKNRVHSSGGGVCLYVNAKYTANVCEDLTINDGYSDSLFIEIKTSKLENLIIGIIYRPPSFNPEIFRQKLEDTLHHISMKKKRCVMLGDFNIDIAKNDKTKNDFMNTIHSFNFSAAINTYTRVTNRSKTIIDNFITNIEYDKVKSGVILSGISDHFPIVLFMKLTNNLKSSTENTKMKILNMNTLTNLRTHLQQKDWTHVYRCHDPDMAYEILVKEIQDSVHSAIPEKTIKDTNRINSWITKDIKKLITNKNNLYKKYIKNPTEENKAKFTQYRNKLTHTIRKAKQKHYTELLNKTQGDVKKTWQVLNRVLGKGPKKSVLPDASLLLGNSTSDDTGLAEVLNTHFISTGENLAQVINNPSHFTYRHFLKNSHSQSFYIMPTNSMEVYETIRRTKSSRSSGTDGICNTTLKAIANEIAGPLAHCINLSLSWGSVPKQAKIAKITPIHKSGDNNDLNNYRPISILPSLSKIYEKIVHTRLYKYIEKYNILDTSQYGFRKNRTTDMAVLDLIEKVNDAFEKGEIAIGVFLDLSKAFDTINLNILLDKLSFYGIRGIALKWFNSYLYGRKQYVSIKGSNSTEQITKHGVPQGSILGPLLYIIYMNDFTNCTDTLKKLLLTDDTNLLHSHHDPSELETITNTEIEKVNIWLKCNKLSLNTKKTNFIIFRSNKNRKQTENVCLNIDGHNINRVEHTKFLGIHIDEKLNFKHHTDLLTKKLSMYSGLFYKLRYHLPSSALLILYRSLFEPHLHYCNIIWCNTYPSYLHKLQCLQKKVIRTIFWSHSRSHTAPLFKAARILKLEDLNTFLNAVTIHQVINKLNHCLCELIPVCRPLHRYGTREKRLYWGKKRKLKTTGLSVACRGFQIWNQLEEEVKLCESLKKFKREMKKMLLCKYTP